MKVAASAFAVSAIRVESVRIYVIKPTVPCLPKEIPSYNCRATIIVFRVLKFNFLAASCCRLLVVNGFAGFRFRSFFSTF